MRDEDYEPKKGEPKLGTFVYSSADCGDDSAIRICFLDWHEKIESYYMSPQHAKKLAKIILEVAEDYEKGIKTYFKA